MRAWPTQTPETLVTTLSAGGQRVAALTVARSLLQIWEQNGQLVTLHAHHMYEHHLPSLVGPLTACCGEDALRLFADLLQEAARITGKIEYGHHTMRPMGDDSWAQHDPYESLISAVRRSAESLIQQDAVNKRPTIAAFEGYGSKIFVRLRLYILALNPGAAPDLATAYVTDPSLIEATWCRDEYSRLALAWFPSLDAPHQAKILGVMDALPDKFLDTWKARFEEHTNAPPNAEDERKFRASVFRDTVWKWREALPGDRQRALNLAVQELGDPDAWRQRIFPPEESPLSGADLSSQPVVELVAFLKSWKPGAEASRQTVTALAQELRIAVANNSENFAVEADQFAESKPVYVRQVLSSLEGAANNRREFGWSRVLKLIEVALEHYNDKIDPTALFEGDDPDWKWSGAKAAELLAAGLRLGADGIPFEHADQVRSIIDRIAKLAPVEPEIEDFEERYQREPFFAAQATLRGLAVELSILFMFWLSKFPSSALAAQPRDALANSLGIRTFLEAQLTDRTSAGRIPRVVMGRYLSFLCYFGEEWVKAHMDALLPQDDEALRNAGWYGHLAHDARPIVELVPQLRPCLAAEIERLGTDAGQGDREFRRDRFGDYLIVLYLWGGLPEDLLTDFWETAPEPARQHCMWYLGTQLPAPDLPEEMRERGFAYWERRLDAGMRSSDRDKFRAELGGIGQWTLRDPIDDEWLAGQLLKMLQADFVPTDAFSVVDWLTKIMPGRIDRAVAILSALLRNPRVDQWAYVTQREPIRAVLVEGLARGTTETVTTTHELIGFLSSINETGYMDLMRPPAA